MATNTQIMQADLHGISLTPSGQIALQNLGQACSFAKWIGQAGMLPKNVTPEAAAVSIIAGASLGLNPFQSAQGIASINGRPALWGDSLVAVVQASGLVEDEQVKWYEDKDHNRVACEYTVKRKGVATPYVGQFSKKMAEKAGLWGKQGPWSQYPDRMLKNRARAFALRDGFADILKGMRIAEEEQDAAAERIDLNDDTTVATITPSKPRRRASAAELLSPAPTVIEEQEEPQETVLPNHTEGDPVEQVAADPVVNDEDFAI